MKPPIILILSQLFLYCLCGNPEWCWTVPDMTIKMEHRKFGYNFGLCKELNYIYIEKGSRVGLCSK
jgi:hypothetical protein